MQWDVCESAPMVIFMEFHGDFRLNRKTANVTYE